MSKRVRYSCAVEFTVDNVLEGGPSKAEIRRDIKRYVESMTGIITRRWVSLADVRVKYIHEATSTMLDKKGTSK